MAYRYHQYQDNKIECKNGPHKETDGKAPCCSPKLVAEQLPIADVIIERDKEYGNPVTDTDGEGDNQHQCAHENLNEDVFGKGEARMPRGKTEHNEGGQYHYHGQYHHGPSRMSHQPLIAGTDYLEVSSPVVAFNFEVVKADILTDYLHEDDIGQRHNEKHVDGFVADLAVAADVLADKVAGAPQKLQERGGQGTGVHAPHIEDAFAHPLPCDAAVAGLLRAEGAVVA